jgi:predicted nucleotidyltransferase component of viral defense system
MKNPAASARARLNHLSNTAGEEFQRLMVRYAIERLLYRLAESPRADDFVLKGATLFSLWLGAPHRATKDLDLLGRGEPDVARLVGVFREIVKVRCEEDGLVFSPEEIVGKPIREDSLYHGVRLVVPCHLDGARIKIQVDVGVGDVTVPPAPPVEFKSILGMPPARLRAYAPETVVAEKLEALVLLGMTTSRMKDLYDLELLQRHFTFDDTLVAAVKATFERRKTLLPLSLPTGLSDQFANDPGKQAQWAAFLRKSTSGEESRLADVVTTLRAWLWPVLQRAALSSPPE